MLERQLGDLDPSRQVHRPLQLHVVNRVQDLPLVLQEPEERTRRS